MNPDLDRMTSHAWVRSYEREIDLEDIYHVWNYGSKVLKNGTFICQLTGREFIFCLLDDQQIHRLLDVVVVLSPDNWALTVYKAA